VSAERIDQPLWRVGYREDPLGFVPPELCAWNHRFDDLHRRFRTVYLAGLAETALREVLADFRPKLSAIAEFETAMGSEAASELPSASITATWREQHVLARANVTLEGSICDLTESGERQKVEEQHATLLANHQMEHLDLHEITTARRVVTQTIASDLYNQGFAAVCFPSRLDGECCLAVFEGRGELALVAEPLALTDPPPDELVRVIEPWHMALEPYP
jgi:RES domain